MIISLNAYFWSAVSQYNGELLNPNVTLLAVLDFIKNIILSWA